ncbi:hypothetical protein KM043_016997 [Ampulex compressa]|nr:hypothetical protein KM043_016997 [Ampulex compressa]
METLRSDSIRTPEAVSTNGIHEIDSLSKEKEDELLYGPGEDADEEEALSDDSLRLRLSDDDEAEAEDIRSSASCSSNQKLRTEKIESAPVEAIDQRPSLEREKVGNERDKPRSDVNQEDYHTGGGGGSYIQNYKEMHGSRRGRRHTLYPHGGPMPTAMHNSQHNPLSSTDTNAFATDISLDSIKQFEENNFSNNQRPTASLSCTPKSREVKKKNAAVPSSSPKLQTVTNNDIIKSDETIKESNTLDAVDNVSQIEHNPTLVKDILQSADNVQDKFDKTSDDTTQSDLPNESTASNIKARSDIHNIDSNAQRISTNDVKSGVSHLSISDNGSSTKETSLAQGVQCKVEKNTIIKVTKQEDMDKTEEFDQHKLKDKDSDVHNTAIKDIKSECAGQVCSLETEKSNEKSTSDERYIDTPHNSTCNQSALLNKDLEPCQSNTTKNESIKNKVTSSDIKKVLTKDTIAISTNQVGSSKDNDGDNCKPDNVLPNTFNNRRLSKKRSSVNNDNKVEILQDDSTQQLTTSNEQLKNHSLKEGDNNANSVKSNKSLNSKNNLTVTDDNKSVIGLQNQSILIAQPMIKNSEQVEKIVGNLERNDIPSVNLNVKDPDQENNTNKHLVSTDKNSSICKGAPLGPTTNTKNISDSAEKKNTEPPTQTQRRRRRTKRTIGATQEINYEEDAQAKETGRQKRRTAKNAAEIIRKKFLNHDSDLESSDGSDKFIIVNHKNNQDARSSSPPSLKRNYPEIETTVINGSTKKLKMNSEISSEEVPAAERTTTSIRNLSYVHKFFQRDIKEKLPKLKQEELEELLIQKIVETITMRSEIGRLREQARISEKNQEATRARCQQLAKQIKDFEMVLNRNAADRRANNDKPTAPIKINRSVGLQVNFMTEHGMQNLRQLQQNSNLKSPGISNGINTPAVTDNNSNALNTRRGIKIRSPRRVEGPTVTQNVTISQIQPPPLISTVTPAALVVTKSVEPQHALVLSSQANTVQQLIPGQAQTPQQQTIVLNGKITNQITRQSTTLNIPKQRSNDLIDLTDEEEKSKSLVNNSPVATSIADQQINMAAKAQTCFQRVIQAIPSNVAMTNQSASIRVVQPASQPTPTALVNNVNAPKLTTYVMQSAVGPTRQLLITSSSNQMRPVTSCNRASFSTLTYKTGISTTANGTVRVLTTPAGPNVQLNKHPAPLPETPTYAVNSVLKFPPPAPSLKISKVANGIVLSWNMTLSEEYADIASYQLYAYQEVAGVPPSTALWKKVGDVRALPLPMACTLTQFSEGNNYYFAVRAVDTHSRKGRYSIPGNISL